MKRRSLVRAEPAPERDGQGLRVLVHGSATLGKTLPRSVGLHFPNQPDVRALARDLAGDVREPVSVRAAIADDIDADGVFRRGGLAPVGRQRCRYHRHHFTSGNRLEVGTEQLRPCARSCERVLKSPLARASSIAMPPGLDLENASGCSSSCCGLQVEQPLTDNVSVNETVRRITRSTQETIRVQCALTHEGISK